MTTLPSDPIPLSEAIKLLAPNEWRAMEEFVAQHLTSSGEQRWSAADLERLREFESTVEDVVLRALESGDYKITAIQLHETLRQEIELLPYDRIETGWDEISDRTAGSRRHFCNVLVEPRVPESENRPTSRQPQLLRIDKAVQKLRGAGRIHSDTTRADRDKMVINWLANNGDRPPDAKTLKKYWDEFWDGN